MKTAIYTRVSTDNQAELEFNSCHAQEAKIRSFISSQEEMEILKVYSDEGCSGANINRPALQELLHDVKNGAVDFVIVYKIDRLTRSPKDFYQLIEVFENNNVSFISVTERFDTSTPAGRLLRNIMLTFAQFERELACERTKDKMLERAKKGLFGGGACPFGYKRVEKKLVVIPSEAQIVRQIFDTYIETASLCKTYNNFKKANILNRTGKPFTKGDLYNMLRKVVYSGRLTHNGEIYKGIHESIVSDEQFEQARELHKCKVKAKWPPAKNYLFPGLVTCKDCGSTMSPTYTNKIKNNKRKRYYFYRCTCTHKRDWTSCPTRQVSATRLDSFVVQNLERIASDQQYVESLSFKLKHGPAGVGQGFELSCFDPANLRESLLNVVKTASIKGGVNKGEMMRKRIKKLIYSKDNIEIELVASNDFSVPINRNVPSSDVNRQSERSGNTVTAASDNRQRPKMPPSIFGRNDRSIRENIADVRDKEKVCAQRDSGGQGIEPR
ncbi:MAG: recombinase family protein [bacterium]